MFFVCIVITVIVLSGKCSEPNVTEYGLNFIGQEQTEEIFRIGSEVKIDLGFDFYY